MIAQQTQTHNGNPAGLLKALGFMLLVILLAFGLINAKGSSQQQPQVINYSDLELSEHAQTAHQGQSWDATRIQAFFIAGNCEPKIDLCDNGREIHSCRINNFSIGLIIDRMAEVIITGFAANGSYWNTVHKRCIGT